MITVRQVSLQMSFGLGSIIADMDYVGNALEDREKSVRKNIPDLLDYKSMLYIGANKRRQHFLDWFINAKYDVTIVEAFKENYGYLKEKFKEHKVIHGDIRTTHVENYDVIFYWHGIEHLPFSDIPNILRKLESKCKLIVLGMPFGVYVQEAEYGNKYEVHESAIYPEFLVQQRYEYETLGDMDQRGANITAWKWMKA